MEQDLDDFSYSRIDKYNEEQTKGLSSLYREVLKTLGEDPDREGLIKTPERVAKAMQFLTQGYHQDPKAILTSAMFREQYSQMVTTKKSES